MAYEGGEELYYTALGLATGAAAMIRRPWAYYVVAMIGVMVSDPGQMSNSSHVWRTTEKGGSTTELASLKTDMDGLRTQLKEKGKWEGDAFEQFDAAYTDFNKSLVTLENVRNNTGEAVDQSATLYYWGAVTCLVVASAMMAGAIILMILRHTLWGNFVAFAFELTLSRAATGSIKKVLIKHGIAVATLGYLFQQAITMSEQAGKLFPGTKAIPNEMSTMKSGGMPEFSETGLTYDPTSGALMPKMDEDLTGKST